MIKYDYAGYPVKVDKIDFNWIDEVNYQLYIDDNSQYWYGDENTNNIYQLDGLNQYNWLEVLSNMLKNEVD